jgi:cell division protein FtsI/penicillin-binding protein 2
MHIIFATILLLYLGIVGRLFYWQIIHGESLRVSAAKQYAQDINIEAKRGEIMTADGSALVVNQPAYIVFAEPNLIEDKDYAATKLSSLLNESSQDIYRLLSEPDRKWVNLKRNANQELKDSIESLNIFGVGFLPKSMRYYPEASMAAHLLGFVGQDDQGEDKGYFGLEGFYDRELSGKEGSMLMQRDAKGGQILIGDATTVEPEDGRTITLWLDRSIQYIAEENLKRGMTKYGAKEGSVIIMDPKSGGILAMASYPNYDPSHYQDYDKAFYANPIVAESYEPGSTFKPLIMAAAMNEHVLSSTTTFPESGPVQIGEYSIKTWNEEYHGTIDMVEVLQYSSNVGMVFVQRQLGDDNIVSYINNYGFGKKTGIDLEDEASPDVRDEGTWSAIDYATASFGQGIAVTPLQITSAMATIANDGWLMEPRVVKEFIDNQGRVVTQKEKKIRQVISAKTAKDMTAMMVDAVKYGEAKWAAPKGYKVAGKTGTAQIPVSGYYDKDKTIASFVGFAPAEDPKFIMLVVLTEPQSSQWGSETAAPLFFTIATEIFKYLGIPPTQ